MPLALSPLTALVTPGGRVSFIASGGTPPYSFSVSTNNSGGSIDPSSGQFLAGPAGLVVDQITLQDAVLDTVTASVTITAGLWQKTQRNIVPPRFRGQNAQTIEGVYGAEKDTEGERARQGILANLPGIAPPDALPIIAAERQLRRSSGDTDATFAEYERTAWDVQYRCGSFRRLLEELDRAGFPMGDPDGAHIVQRYKRYCWLSASGGSLVEGTLPHSFDFSPLPRWFPNQFLIIFGADVPDLTEGSVLADTLNDIVATFKPVKADYYGTSIILSEPVWGWPVTEVWGTTGSGGSNLTWGGGSTRFISP